MYTGIGGTYNEYLLIHISKEILVLLDQIDKYSIYLSGVLHQRNHFVYFCGGLQQIGSKYDSQVVAIHLIDLLLLLDDEEKADEAM